MIVNDEIIVKNTLQTDLFSIQNINKIYQKSIKLQMIALSFIKISLVELAFDINIKVAMRKMVNALTVPLVNLFDMLILKKISREIVKSSLNEKIQKILKVNKINRNSKLIEIFYQYGKSIDAADVVIKQFSK